MIENFLQRIGFSWLEVASSTLKGKTAIFFYPNFGVKKKWVGVKKKWNQFFHKTFPESVSGVFDGWISYPGAILWNPPTPNSITSVIKLIQFLENSACFWMCLLYQKYIKTCSHGFETKFFENFGYDLPRMHCFVQFPLILAIFDKIFRFFEFDHIFGHWMVLKNKFLAKYSAHIVFGCVSQKYCAI